MVDIISTKCPFCQELIAPGTLPLAHHIGRHMEEVSYAVVSKPHEDWQFYGDTSSEGSSDQPAQEAAVSSLDLPSKRKSVASLENEDLAVKRKIPRLLARNFELGAKSTEEEGTKVSGVTTDNMTSALAKLPSSMEGPEGLRKYSFICECCPDSPLEFDELEKLRYVEQKYIP
jgi:hypothetical protein